MNILILIGHYLPGEKSGGPVRSISRLVGRLGDEHQFSIITSDRDLGDNQRYPKIEPNIWYSLAKSRVIYLSPSHQSFSWLAQLIRSIQPDVIYLTGFFSHYTRKVLLLRWLRLITSIPIIVAPQGEFSTGAMSLKFYKKRPYIFVSQLLGITRNIVWHASTPDEAALILRQTPRLQFMKANWSQAIEIAPDLVAYPATDEHNRVDKIINNLRLVFLSRVARKKNLDYVLKLLKNVSCKIQLDVYGPIEDKGYWSECQTLIASLPSNVVVTYCGIAEASNVSQLLSQYHLFVLPTRGENFGHAVYEALASGCPVLISDQTPWRELQESHAGWDISLAHTERFLMTIEACAKMDYAAWDSWSQGARRYARSIAEFQASTTLPAYRQLLMRAKNCKP